MTAASIFLATAILQSGETELAGDMTRFMMITAGALLLIVILAIYVFKGLKPKSDSKVSQELRAEFEKSKEALLLAAQARKAGKENDEGMRREAEREARERELLKENVEPARVIGQDCPICRLEMMDDQELAIDPYTGQGYHFSCFLMEWPVDTDKPKYLYRFPQETVVRSEDLGRSF